MIDRKYEVRLRILAVLFPLITLGLIILSFDSYEYLFSAMCVMYILGPVIAYFLADCLGENKVGLAFAAFFFSMFILPYLALSDRHVDRIIKKLKKAKRFEKDNDAFDYLEAKMDLRKVENPRAIEDLVQFLKDEIGDIRKEVATTLSDIKNEYSVEPLIKLLKGGSIDVRKCAAWTLGEIGYTRAVEPLIQALEDEDKYVREAVEEALEKIKANKS